MRFEHLALNVTDARAMAAWYVQHLGLSVVRALESAPHTHFLADATGRTVLEVYSNPAAPYPNYKDQHWLVLHVAFVSADADADRARLERAGATPATVDALPDGSRLVMMRDPWGVCLQLCQRARPMP